MVPVRAHARSASGGIAGDLSGLPPWISRVLRHSSQVPAQTIERTKLARVSAGVISSAGSRATACSRSSRTAPSVARLRLVVRSCAPLRSAQWSLSKRPRCTRARRIGGGHRAACDCATRDAAPRMTSRLGAPAREPPRPSPTHAVPISGSPSLGRRHGTPRRGARATSPSHRPPAGQRAGRWVGWELADRWNEPPHRSTETAISAQQGDPSKRR